MIDTDKYEGHTEGPWDWFPTPNDSHIGHLQRHSNLTRVTAEIKSRSAENDANAQLIADAPLLLEEVKRLRMYEVAWKMLYDNAKEEGRETRTRTWKEIMELVRCDVREMVDTGDAVFDEWAKRTIGGLND